MFWATGYSRRKTRGKADRASKIGLEFQRVVIVSIRAGMHTLVSNSCPGVVELTFTTVSLSLLVMFVAGMVGHGILRPLLEARGVAPWRLRDSLGSMPLVLLGSGVIGGTGMLLGLWGVTGCHVSGASVALTSAALVVGTVMTRLGLHALRKLS